MMLVPALLASIRYGTMTLAACLLAGPLAAQHPAGDYSAPAGAPYTAQNVTVRTPMGHTLAGTLTLPASASRTHPVAAIVTITGTGPQDRD
ncbi:MAG TPA: hypothetical protein VII52_05770, partial [Gemmatimonadaceae bacterium]